MSQFRPMTFLLILVSCTPNFNQRVSIPLNSAIINGQEIRENAPIAVNVVGLYNKKKNTICTGSLIAPNIVLTAAHCAPERLSHLSVVFSTNIDSTINAREQDILQELVLSATDFKVSPNWNPKDEEREQNTGDIALIKFKGDAPENYKLTPLLSEESTLKVGDLVTIAGYGFNTVQTTPVSENQFPSIEKAYEDGDIFCQEDEKGKPYQCVTVEMSGDSILRKAVAPIDRILETEIILDEHKAGTCNGDSGGPAYILKDNQYYLFGVTSRGSELCNEFGAYTNALKYKNWINETIKTLK
ncbi:MAG: trypsin-like serine protease [Bacteriovorax sp.]|nr:trypsin-like serine protease [Bacteriovorax sp.]